VLLVLLGLGLLLAFACIRESRSGKPAWGTRRAPVEHGPTPAEAAKAAKRVIASTAAVGLFIGMGDGA
jgi:hypothetical protein